MLACHAGLNWGQTDRIFFFFFGGGARCVHGITAAFFVPNWAQFNMLSRMCHELRPPASCLKGVSSIDTETPLSYLEGPCAYIAYTLAYILIP